MGKTKDLCAFVRGIVVGAMLSGFCQDLQDFLVFHTQVSRGPPLKRHSANLTQLWEALESWASIPVERFRHQCIYGNVYRSPMSISS